MSRLSMNDYQEQGFTGPIHIFSQEEAAVYRQEFYRVIGQDEHNPVATEENLSAFHQRHRWAYDICSHPSLVHVMSQLLESDSVVLWAMHFWYKEPGNNKYIPWHQDYSYWPMDPAINATAWVALGDCHVDNGCLRLIPGTHKHIYEHNQLDEASAFAQGINDIDDSAALNMEMQPGQACFFNEGIVHGSRANTSDHARVACSIRYTTPEVRFKMEEWSGDVDRIKTYLLKGEDRFHYNDAIIGEIPAQDDNPVLSAVTI